jgi:hypothetical protein
MEWKVVDCRGYNNNTIVLTAFATYTKAHGKYQHHKRGASQQKTKKGVVVVLVMLLNITIEVAPPNNTMSSVKNNTSRMKDED